jgi:hypothetical protein
MGLYFLVFILYHQGGTMTWLLLDDVTKKVVCHSAVCTVLNPTKPNQRADQKSIDGHLSTNLGELHLPIHSVSDLPGQLDKSSLKLPSILT